MHHKNLEFQQIIPETIEKNPIIVLGVTTFDNENESMLQEPCCIEEFLTYTFE